MFTSNVKQQVLHWRGLGGLKATIIGWRKKCTIKDVRMFFFFFTEIPGTGQFTTSLGTLCSLKSGVITAFTTEEMEGWRRNEGSWVCEDGKAHWVISL